MICLVCPQTWAEGEHDQGPHNICGSWEIGDEPGALIGQCQPREPVG
jgi:hypothetical protein